MKIGRIKKHTIHLLLFYSIFTLAFLFHPVIAEEEEIDAKKAAADLETENIRAIPLPGGEESFKKLKLVTDIFGLVPNGTKTIAVEKDGDTLRDIINGLLKILITFAGTIAVIMLAVHGTGMIYGKLSGNVGKVLDMRTKLTGVVIAIVLLLLSYLILQFINPRLLDSKLLSGLSQTSLQTQKGDKGDDVAEPPDDDGCWHIWWCN